jgi:chitin synthase
VNVFEVGITLAEFCSRYRQGLQEAGVIEGSEREVIEQARQVFRMSEWDLVLGVHKVRYLKVVSHGWKYLALPYIGLSFPVCLP